MSARPELHLGHVMHRRLRPVLHTFVYPVFYVVLPLRDLAAARCAVFSIDRWNLLSFHRADHGPRDGGPLLPWIEAQLRERGLPDDGEILLQTFPRVLGLVFNPVSFWYCHDHDGRLIAVLAEVNNTFGGRHHYLLHRPDGVPLGADCTLCADKTFHVSPFNEVSGSYRFRFQRGDARARVCIDHDDADGPLLLTAISGRIRPWGLRPLLAACLRMPLLTVGVVVRIHWQALKLWLKGVPFRGARPPSSASPSHPAEISS